MLTDAKTGDKLIVSGDMYRRVETVTRTTKTTVHTAQHVFNRQGKMRNTYRWSRQYAKIATEAEIEEIAEMALRQRLIGQIENLVTRPKLAGLRTNVLGTIYKLLESEVCKL